MIICNLAVLLAERQLKITRISNDTGISRTTLTSLRQNDAKGIQFDTINTLCNYLSVEPKDFFDYSPLDFSVKFSLSENAIEFDYDYAVDSEQTKGIPLGVNIDGFLSCISPKGNETIELSINLSTKGNIFRSNQFLINCELASKNDKINFSKIISQLSIPLKTELRNQIGNSLKNFLHEKENSEYISEYFDWKKENITEIYNIDLF
ncbi:helix-turn-helix domain-containing protein [Liquorilactobacillus hordei]|uniref:helix-turn-helix domain-containing protein n=1 Tax=Liquorilactobacillus hordei TaxID=468911 RepID=UPI0039E907A1